MVVSVEREKLHLETKDFLVCHLDEKAKMEGATTYEKSIRLLHSISFCPTAHTSCTISNLHVAAHSLHDIKPTRNNKTFSLFSRSAFAFHYESVHVARSGLPGCNLAGVWPVHDRATALLSSCIWELQQQSRLLAACNTGSTSSLVVRLLPTRPPPIHGLLVRLEEHQLSICIARPTTRSLNNPS